MTPLPPVVVGPLSNLNKTVEVSGQITGAMVTVRANGTVIAKGTATWGNQVLPLLTGASISAGQSVTARQEVNGVSSADSPHPVVVQQAPAHLGHVVFSSPIFQCTETVEIGGAVPGAKVEVGVRPGGIFTERGATRSPNGWAEVTLDTPTATADTLVARQLGGGWIGPFTPATPPEPVEKGLPTLTVDTPMDCAQFITIHNAVPGATIVMMRPTDSRIGVFLSDPVTFDVGAPLTPDETITVSQSFPPCGFESPSSTVTVPAPTTPPVPVLVGSLCPKSEAMTVTNLLPGALVRFLSDGSEIGEAQAPSNSFTFALPTLTAGATITAEQQLCETWSAPSNPVTVGSSPSNATVAVAAPLIACGGAVHVSGLAAGDWVEVLSGDLGAPIAYGMATATDMDIPVSPLLIAGDEITARVTGCRTAHSAPVKVRREPKTLKPPTVETPTEGDASLKVINIEPGALVDVFVNEMYRSGGFCGAASESISVVTPLALNDKVKARQRICAVTSAFSSEVNTLPPLPVAGIKVLTPSSGLTPLHVQFADTSTGEEIDHWEWDSIDPNNQQTNFFAGPNTPVETFSTVGTWVVKHRVGNPAGWSLYAQVTITVIPPPPQAVAHAAPTAGAAPLTVNFSVGAAPGYPYALTSAEWNFNDGQSGSGLSTTHVYMTTGTFHPTVTAKNLGGTTSPAVPVISVPVQRPVLTISVDPTAQGPTLVFTGSKFIQNSITLKASFETGPNAGHSAEMPVPPDEDNWQLGTFTFNWLASSDVCNGDALNPIQIQWTATDGTHDPANPSQPLWSNPWPTKC